MGNKIIGTATDKMAENQRAMQTEMMAKQQDMQLRMMERQRRLMVAQAVSQQRELFTWVASTYALGVTAVGALTYARGNFPKVALAPITIYGIFLAYQYDMAYGSKMERINGIMNDILTKETDKHWFTPLSPSDSDVKYLKQQKQSA